MEYGIKYKVGQTVYACSITLGSERVTCPDCLGTKAWAVTTPAGEEFSISCAACKHGYEVRGSIAESKFIGQVEEYTIGSVRLDTSIRDGRDCVSYMCEETGVGSGRVWDQPALYATREEAKAVLPGLMDQRQREHEDSLAMQHKRRKSDGPGEMAAYYRAQIRDAKKAIKAAERGLQREGRSRPRTQGEGALLTCPQCGSP